MQLPGKLKEIFLSRYSINLLDREQVGSVLDVSSNVSSLVVNLNTPRRVVRVPYSLWFIFLTTRKELGAGIKKPINFLGLIIIITNSFETLRTPMKLRIIFKPQ